MLPVQQSLTPPKTRFQMGEPFRMQPYQLPGTYVTQLVIDPLPMLAAKSLQSQRGSYVTLVKQYGRLRCDIRSRDV